MEMSDEAFRLWSENDLKNTETLLSEEIERGSKPNHHPFANRALVRARSGQSTLAIQDAEESLRIQPSPIGHIAMAIALLYRGDWDGSLWTFDLAFQECEPRDIQLLLILKAILVFERGKQDIAISRITSLAERANDDSVYLLDQVLGSMYMKKGEYGRAISYFEAAKNTGPTTKECHPMATISLIFGWAFDELNMASKQRLYETVFTEGRISEAADILQNIVKESGEDAGKSKVIADWLVDFTQKYAATRESRGDQANQASATTTEKHQDANPWSSEVLYLDSEGKSD